MVRRRPYVDERADTARCRVERYLVELSRDTFEKWQSVSPTAGRSSGSPTSSTSARRLKENDDRLEAQVDARSINAGRKATS